MTKECFVKSDSHAHITSDELYPRADELIQNAIVNGVTKIVNINTDQETLKRGLELAKKYPENVFNTAASTPHDVETLGPDDFPVFEKAAREGKLIALGETGLDYFYERANREVQQQFLRKYLALAKELHMSVAIHCRGDEAFVDLFKITSDFPTVKILLHCFTGTLGQANEAIARDWYISFSGILTFKKSIELREVMKQLPMDRIVIETDSPYLAPEGKRGKVNEPANVSAVAETIALHREMELEAVCAATLKNTFAIFPKLI